MSRDLVLRLLLIGGALYYLIGAVAHLFGLTIFPFNDGVLYAPYHDTVIALVAIILSLLLLSIARNPEKNIDAFYVVLIGGILAIIFSISILLKVDFAALNAPYKKTQTFVELILLIFYIPALYICRPKKIL